MNRRVLLSVVCISLLAGSFGPPISAASDEYACIVKEVRDPYTDDIVYTEVCWVIGSDGSYTVIDTEPPVLYPQIGSNSDGSECWYWTTAVTQWVILSRTGSVATIGQDLGVGVVLDTTVDACQGIPGEDLRSVAWNYLRAWLLAEPVIEMSPINSGVTGFETFVWASIPDRIDGTLTSPAGTTLQARAWIDQVVVDWGDASASPLVLGEDQLDRFVAYPDGSAYHVYETKTCNEDGQTGCYPEVEGYPITVSFRWQAAYRVGANAWIDIGPVSPNATLSYPVDEIITRIDTTG